MWHLIFIVILSISAFEECSSSFISRSDAGTIIINDFGEISCDDVICPKNTFKCRIVRTPIEKTRNVQVTRTCLGQKGEIMSEEKKETLAPYEGFSSNVEADINGNFITNGQSFSAEDAAKINARIAEQTNRILYETQLRNQQIQQHVQQVLQNVNNNLQYTLGNIFGRR